MEARDCGSAEERDWFSGRFAVQILQQDALRPRVLHVRLHLCLAEQSEVAVIPVRGREKPQIERDQCDHGTGEQRHFGNQPGDSDGAERQRRIEIA